MQQTAIQEVKSNLDRHIVVNHISLSNFDKPYLYYSDSDCSTDYFNACHYTINETIEKIKTQGADSIQITTDYQTGLDDENKKELNKLLKKINRICKGSNYINKVKIEQRHNEIDGLRQEWIEVVGTIERMFEGVN